MLKALVLILGIASSNAMAAHIIECVSNEQDTKLSKVIVRVADGYGDMMEIYDDLDKLVSATPAEYGDDVDYAFYTSDEADVMVSYIWHSKSARTEGIITMNFNAGPREDIPATCTRY